MFYNTKKGGKETDDMNNPQLPSILEKNFHLDKNYVGCPVEYGEISLIQIGRLYCNTHTVIGMHTHQNWFELTVVTDGCGSVIVGNTSVEVTQGDIHLAYPGDFHEIHSDPKNPLKYDFFSFYPKSPFLLERLEAIMQSHSGGNERVIRDEKINRLLENAIAEINRPSELSSEILGAVFYQIVLYLIRDFQHTEIEKKETIGAPEQLCYQMMHYIDTHIYTIDGLYELSDTMRYNYSYLSDIFKKVTGETLQEYYQGRRLRAAQLLLMENTLKLGEIANLLRYSSIYAFSRAFKDRFGISPSEYRKEKVNSAAEDVKMQNTN